MSQPLNILVTGGAGFIGSALVRHLVQNTPHNVLNVDALTYAGNLQSLASVAESDRYDFVQANICDTAKITEILRSFKPDVVTHLAAESHVDRSIDGPAAFIETNLDEVLAKLKVSQLYICGAETNNCVRHTSMGALGVSCCPRPCQGVLPTKAISFLPVSALVSIM
mgnify:CR=1 FL=1